MASDIRIEGDVHLKSRIINSLSTAVVALFFSHVLHETVHLVSALITGAQVRRFNLFAVDIVLFGEAEYMWQDIIIEAGASVVNVLAGFLALFLFYRLKPGYPLLKLLFLQVSGYNLLMGFGYFLFDSLFYSPDLAGDWRSVITMLEGSIALRVILIILGAAGMLFVMFQLAQGVLVFVKEKEVAGERRKAAFPILLMPYLVLGAVYSLLSLWHPLEFPVGLIITVLQFFFGFSGLLWAYFLAVHWLSPKKGILFYGPLPEKLNRGWLLTATLIMLLKIFVLLPTIEFL